MLLLWPIFWLLAMLALITVTVVTAMKEKKARAKAAPAFNQAGPIQSDAGAPVGGADAFGTAGSDFASMDDAFK